MNNPSDFIIENGILKKYVGPGGDVEIPEGVTEIGEGAFRSCKKLKSVKVPEGVTDIGCYAFKGCDKLTDVSLPDTVLHISGDGPFEGTALYRDESRWDNGILYLNKCLIKAQNEIADVCVVREGIRCIADAAFAGCKMLNYVELPKGLVSIGSVAFANCDKLSRLDIPQSVTELGFDAFQSCRSLLQVNLPKGIRKIEGQLFFECSSLTDITLPDGVVSIGNHAFGDCYSLTRVALPSSVTSIGGWAFAGCNSLISVKIPEGVTNINSNAFRGCSSLKEVTIPKGVTCIEEHTFSGCSSLTEITVPEGVVSIGDYAFGSSGIATITLPESLEKASEECFSWKATLQLARVKKWNPAISTIFRKYTVEKIITEDFSSLPSKYKPAGAFGFITEKSDEQGTETCKAVLDYLKKNAGKIYAYAFDHPQLLYFLVERGLIAAKDVDTFISEAEKRADAEKKALLLDYQNRIGTETVTRARVKKEKSKAQYTDALTERIASRDSSKGIEGMTFVITGKLSFRWKTRKEVQDYMKSYGAVLDSAVTKKTDYLVTNDTDSGSEKNRKAKEYGVKVISEAEFNEMIGWHFRDAPQITIPAWLKEIPNNAFAACSSLTSITIPNGVKKIGDFAFANCSSLTSVTIPKSVTSIGGSVFWGCKALTSVTIPKSVKKIENDAFHWCDKLTIHAPAGSYAEQYAKENNIPFVAE